MSDAKEEKETSKTLADLTVEEFRRLYYDELLKEADIAELYGTHQVAINRWRKKHGLPGIGGKTGRNTARLPPLTPLQKELLVGSLLGAAPVARARG